MNGFDIIHLISTLENINDIYEILVLKKPRKYENWQENVNIVMRISANILPLVTVKSPLLWW